MVVSFFPPLLKNVSQRDGHKLQHLDLDLDLSFRHPRIWDGSNPGLGLGPELVSHLLVRQLWPDRMDFLISEGKLFYTLIPCS